MDYIFNDVHRDLSVSWFFREKFESFKMPESDDVLFGVVLHQ